MVEKYGFASYTMIQNNIAEATHSFMKDNIQPGILKQIIESKERNTNIALCGVYNLVTIPV